MSYSKKTSVTQQHTYKFLIFFIIICLGLATSYYLVQHVIVSNNSSNQTTVLSSSIESPPNILGDTTEEPESEEPSLVQITTNDTNQTVDSIDLTTVDTTNWDKDVRDDITTQQVAALISSSSASFEENYLLRSNNLSDLQNVESARTNLGLGVVSLLDSIDVADTNLAVSSPLVLTGNTLFLKQSVLTIAASQISDLSSWIATDSSVLANSVNNHAPLSVGTNTANGLSLINQQLSLNDVFVQNTGDAVTGKLEINPSTDVTAVSIIRPPNGLAPSLRIANTANQQRIGFELGDENSSRLALNRQADNTGEVRLSLLSGGAVRGQWRLDANNNMIFQRATGPAGSETFTNSFVVMNATGNVNLSTLSFGSNEDFFLSRVSATRLGLDKDMQIGGSLRLGSSGVPSNTFDLDGTAKLRTLAGGDVNLDIQAISSQTADFIQLKSSGGTVLTRMSKDGGAVFNEGGLDADFRVEGMNNANLLFIDASTNNVGIGTSSPMHPLVVFTANGAHVTSGGVWTDSSSKSVKENFQSISSAEILDKITQLDIKKWNYIAEDDAVTHIGPFAEEFNTLFGVGADQQHLAALDTAGVALVGIQELDQRMDQLESHFNFSEAVISLFKKLVVDAAAEFRQEVTFFSAVRFKSELQVSENTTGILSIPKGASKIKVTFSTPFSEVPVVTVTPQQSTNSGYKVSEVAKDHFVLELNGIETEDVYFGWLALIASAEGTVSTEVIE